MFDLLLLLWGVLPVFPGGVLVKVLQVHFNYVLHLLFAFVLRAIFDLLKLRVHLLLMSQLISQSALEYFLSLFKVQFLLALSIYFRSLADLASIQGSQLDIRIVIILLLVGLQFKFS